MIVSICPLGVEPYLLRSSKGPCGGMTALEWTDVDLSKLQLWVKRGEWKGEPTVPQGGRPRPIPRAIEEAIRLMEAPAPPIPGGEAVEAAGIGPAGDGKPNMVTPRDFGHNGFGNRELPPPSLCPPVPRVPWIPSGSWRNLGGGRVSSRRLNMPVTFTRCVPPGSREPSRGRCRRSGLPSPLHTGFVQLPLGSIEPGKRTN